MKKIMIGICVAVACAAVACVGLAAGFKNLRETQEGEGSSVNYPCEIMSVTITKENVPEGKYKLELVQQNGGGAEITETVGKSKTRVKADPAVFDELCRLIDTLELRDWKSFDKSVMVPVDGDTTEVTILHTDGNKTIVRADLVPEGREGCLKQIEKCLKTAMSSETAATVK